MKKKWSMAKGLLLLTVCVCFAGKMNVFEAKAASVSMKRGEEVYYDGYSTFYYYIDGKLGYCLEPKKSSPHEGEFAAEKLGGDTLLSKALYYMYGGPGYDKYMKPKLPESYQGKERAYCLSHCVLSYVYDNCNKSSDAFLGLGDSMKTQVQACTKAIREFPKIPEPDLAFDPKVVNAYFEPAEKVQRTEEIVCLGDEENYVELTLPEDVVLSNLTKKTENTGKVKIYGGDRFYLYTGATKYNGRKWESGKIYGVNRQKWRSLVINTGAGGQHIGTGYLVTAEVEPLSLAVNWIPVPELVVDKYADKEEKIFKVGDVITYTVDVTQQIEKAVAKNVTITDTILTEGVKLQKNSIVLLDKDQSVISDAVISVKGNSYTIRAGEFLRGIETGEKYTVEYQVVITDESVIGKEIENEVIVRADNAEEEKDREKVKVEEPEEPVIPEETPPEKPEEPVVPEKIPLEKPEKPAPKPQIKIIKEKESVKTADEQNVGIIAVFMLLSCVGILGCGRMTHKIK